MSQLPVYVSQAAVPLGLKWYPGDPVNLSWIVDAEDWSGTYTAKVRRTERPDSTELATLTVTATYSSQNDQTTFTVTLSDALSDNVPPGMWYWSCRATAGLTRFAGPVIVDE